MTPKEPENFEFHFSSRPDLSDLCTIPMDSYELFCHPTDNMGKNNTMQFTSFGETMHKEGFADAMAIFKKLSAKQKLDSIFVHASSKKEWDDCGEALGVKDKIHHVYPYTGNLVSASVPTAIHDAIERKTLNRGDEIALWVGSAGMSFSVSRLVY